MENINERNLDYAESALLKLIKEGNATALIFFLKTKGKHRGYIERSELTGKDGTDLNHSIQVEIIDSRQQVTTNENTDDTNL